MNIKRDIFDNDYNNQLNTYGMALTYGNFNKIDNFIQQQLQQDVRINQELQIQLQNQFEKQQQLQQQYLLLQMNQNDQQQQQFLAKNTQEALPLYDFSKNQQQQFFSNEMIGFQQFQDFQQPNTTNLLGENLYYSEENYKLFYQEYPLYNVAEEETRMVSMEPPLTSPSVSNYSMDSGSHYSEHALSSPAGLEQGGVENGQMLYLSNSTFGIKDEDEDSNLEFSKVVVNNTLRSKKKPKSTINSKLVGEKYISQPGPIPASAPKIIINNTGEEMLIFSYSKKKIVSEFSLRCPAIDFTEPLDYGKDFLIENCIYKGAMCAPEEYHGKRGKYERECNIIGWKLAILNPEIRGRRGLIQRAVDSWRNTRKDLKIRSRRVRKEHRLQTKKKASLVQ